MVPERKEYPKMLVWDSTEIKETRERIVLFINNDGSCQAVTQESEEDFLKGKEVQLIDWDQCKAIPEKELMTPKECVGWAYNEGMTGWQIRYRDSPWSHPTKFTWDDSHDMENFKRRKISPTGVISEPEKMWRYNGNSK